MIELNLKLLKEVIKIKIEIGLEDNINKPSNLFRDKALLMQYWGYVHINGNLIIKRYFDQRDVEDAKVSEFVYKVIPPFYARSKEEAEKHCINLVLK
jgi:hypothetical protein